MTKSLTLTKEVLRYRSELENFVESLHRQLNQGLVDLDKFEQTVTLVNANKHKIDQNKDFIYYTTETENYKEFFTNENKYTTICSTCKWTCHENCAYKDNSEKMNCCAMNNDGFCRCCPGKCHWAKHTNEPFVWKRKEKKVKQTNQALKDKYLDGQSKESQYVQIANGLRKDIEKKERVVINSVKDIKFCINEINRLALRANILQTNEYFDLLIESERKHRKLNWQARVKLIESLKKKNEMLREVTNDDWSPFSEKLNKAQADMKVSQSPKKTRGLFQFFN